MALSSKIQALINYANETTRAGDTRLGDAVKTLCDGYGGGGGGPTFYDYLMPTTNNNNGAYIDTGVATPADGADVRIVLAFDNLGKNSMKMFGSTLSAANSSEMCISTYTSTSVRFDTAVKGYNSVMGTSAPHVCIARCKVRTTTEGAALSADGNSASASFGAATIRAEGNFSLFGYYVNAWGRMGTDQFKCYGLEIYIDGKKVFHGIPASDSNGAGMYDAVSGTMKYNANTNGAFEVGNDE